MSEKGHLPPLKIARRVTTVHGERFAAEWFKESINGPGYVDAFSRTGLVRWPDGDAFTPAQKRHIAITDEIITRTLAATQPAKSRKHSCGLQPKSSTERGKSEL